MHHVLFLLICFIWGSNFLLMKRASAVFGPISIGAYRVLGGAIVLGVIWALLGRKWPFKRKHIVPFVFIVLVGYTWPFTVQPYLIARHGGGFIGMMVSLVPLLTILVSIPMLGVWPTPRQALGVLGGLFFIGIIFREGNVHLDVPIADLMLAGTVPLAYCLSNVVLRKHCADVGTLPLAFGNLTLAAMLLLPVGWAVEGIEPNRIAATGSTIPDSTLWIAIACVVWLGTVGTGAANSMFYKLIQEHGPLFASMVTYLIPTVALFWGWVDGEKITSIQVGALVGTFVMIALVQMRPREKITGAEELA